MNYNEMTVRVNTKNLKPKLYVICGDDVREFYLEGQTTLGRRTSDNFPDINISSWIVSRRHGLFITSLGGTVYQDIGSTNGTLFAGGKLEKGMYTTLKNGDVLRIRALSASGSDKDVVLVYSTDYPKKTCWQKISLSEDIRSLEVGRGSGFFLQDMTASRHHATFFLSRNGWSIIDNKSRNGVFLNGRRLGDPVLLRPMDVVNIANHLFVFLGDSLLVEADEMPAGAGRPGKRTGASRPAVENPWFREPVPVPGEIRGGGKKLSIRIVERNAWNRLRKKTLLRNINLQIDSGSLVLILGGSGAGKTTFMNAVMGYEPAKGSIAYGNSDIYREYEKMKYEIGYVPQQDLLRMEDVVYDTLDNAAHMRLPESVSPAERENLVENALNMFGLSREKGSLVGKLSGGQRKRLSIAVEYIGNPSLFFLDEPDSGLDGIMAKELMNNLRQIADQGKIVMVISHAPDRAFDLFDKIIVLAKSAKDDSGHLVYFGPPKDACRFFDTKTLEGIVGRINRKDEGGEGLADEYIRKYEDMCR